MMLILSVLIMQSVGTVAERAKQNHRKHDYEDGIELGFKVGSIVKVPKTMFANCKLPKDESFYEEITLKYLNLAHVHFYYDNSDVKIPYKKFILVEDEEETKHAKSEIKLQKNSSCDNLMVNVPCTSKQSLLPIDVIEKVEVSPLQKRPTTQKVTKRKVLKKINIC